MKQLGIGVLVLALVVTTVVDSTGSSPVAAQDEAEATISVLMTEVAELQTQVAELTTPTARSTAVADESTPSSEGLGESRYLGGDGEALIPGGAESELSVVLVGRYDGNSLPLVVRNNTDQEVADVSVSAVARGADNALLATGGDHEFKPNNLVPGDVTMGFIYFDGAELPPGVTFEFDVSASEPSDGSFSRRDFVVDEAALVGDRVVGVLSNPHSEDLRGPFNVYLLCLGDDGSVLGFHQDYTDKEAASPGETVPFQVTMYGEVSCPHFIVAASGYNL